MGLISMVFRNQYALGRWLCREQIMITDEAIDSLSVLLFAIKMKTGRVMSRVHCEIWTWNQSNYYISSSCRFFGRSSLDSYLHHPWLTVNHSLTKVRIVSAVELISTWLVQITKINKPASKSVHCDTSISVESRSLQERAATSSVSPDSAAFASDNIHLDLTGIWHVGHCRNLTRSRDHYMQGGALDIGFEMRIMDGFGIHQERYSLYLEKLDGQTSSSFFPSILFYHSIILSDQSTINQSLNRFTNKGRSSTADKRPSDPFNVPSSQGCQG